MVIKTHIEGDLKNPHIDENQEEPHYNLNFNEYDDDETKFLVKKNSSPTLNTNS